MALSCHDWKIVDWDIKPQNNVINKAIDTLQAVNFSKTIGRQNDIKTKNMYCYRNDLFENEDNELKDHWNHRSFWHQLHFESAVFLPLQDKKNRHKITTIQGRNAS